MTSLNTIVRASIAAVNKKTLDGRDVVDRMPDAADVQLGSGTGYGKADIAFKDKRTLSASTSENIDLAGSLSDAFGQTITAAKVKAILIENPEASTSNLSVGGAASNAFVGPFADATDIIVLKPGDRFVAVSRTGWTVTAGTGDILKVANGAGGSVDYDIELIMASA
ncbi:hypothetical protein E4K66_30785 [Bradyrhizobium frederickii]|uniref:Uncharacterized protein n=1 Tax=Bradyrhizobium frederickii TaxID=2560054 RepID=A0A4Y9KTU4_9BRAD|nr:hypothetical protein [Bradyrhizobium frederickii]TFV34555.1 hypothetical protein E4K66_30785 [Bradyrhizobium frederickii]